MKCPGPSKVCCCIP